jgi:hypothetical protein
MTYAGTLRFQACPITLTGFSGTHSDRVSKTLFPLPR